jgi:hypothetical protein
MGSPFASDCPKPGARPEPPAGFSREVQALGDYPTPGAEIPTPFEPAVSLARLPRRRLGDEQFSCWGARLKRPPRVALRGRRCSSPGAKAAWGV